MSDDHSATATARSAFRERFGERPTVVASAPGRVNLVGGHVDYSGGIVLPVAIDRRTVVAVRPRADGRIRAYSTRMDETVTSTIDEVPAGWSAYVVGTAAMVAEAADFETTVGADLVVGGDMLVGAGLSSSASLEVAAAGALNEVHDLGLDDEELATACWRAERGAVGVDCGIMDQYVSALAKSEHALRLDCRSRSYEHVPFDTSAMGLLVVETNVSHELAASGYNDRVRECEAAVAQLADELGRPIRSLRDVQRRDLDVVESALDAPFDRRVRHVVTEMERVETAARALSTDEYQRVGTAISASHRSLREDYEVSCAELDTVVDACHDCPGVYGARMVGGGWGGSVVALVEPGCVDAVTATIESRYRTVTGADCDVHRVGVSGGLRVEE